MSLYQRVAGAEGLKLYEQWRSSRAPGAAPCVCMQSTVVSPAQTGGGGLDDPQEVRRRTAVMTRLDRLIPEASLPIGEAETLEFMQRCNWLGISLPQGANLRAHNRRSGLIWP